MKTPTIPYRYCFNSYGLVHNPSGSFYGRTREAEISLHVPPMDGYIAGDELTLAYEGTVTTTATARGCEVLFRLFNAPWERPDEYAGPSMSIGDVVTFFPGTKQESSFAVGRVGFVPVSTKDSKIMPRPDRWMRDEKQLAIYRQARVEDSGGF